MTTFTKKTEETEEKKEVSGEILEGPESAMMALKRNTSSLKKTLTLPVNEIRDFASGEKEVNPLFIHFTTGLNLKYEKGNVIIRNNQFLIWGFMGLLVTTIVLAIALAAVSGKKTVIYKDKDKVSKKNPLQEVFDINSLKEVESSEEHIKKLPLQAMRVYASSKEIISEVKSSEAKSLKILNEAKKLRIASSLISDKEEKIKLAKQAIRRLKAILNTGKVSNFRRGEATRLLWRIYHCDLHWKKGAKDMADELRRYNARSKYKFRMFCPE